MSFQEEFLDWQTEWGKSLRTVRELLDWELISSNEAQALEPVLEKYRFVLPRYYASLIDRANPLCPIRLQAIPSLSETEEASSFFKDPLQDALHQPSPRITHRYKNRLLLHLTSNCSMYCRYCFRKTLLNAQKTELFSGEVEESFRYIEMAEEIEEVILSGGDPLMLGDGSLAEALTRLTKVGHLKRIRIHTRVPVTFPMRITEALKTVLESTSKPLIIVTHFNHPKELTPESRKAIELLKTPHSTLLNQSVLLKHVNDSAETLKSLSEGLFNFGILPYYLHHPDRAEGTHHFDISIESGLALEAELKASLPGYLVPRYVIDDITHPYKSVTRSTI